MDTDRGVVVQGCVPSWRPVMSGVLQGSILGLVHFSGFINNISGGIGCTLNKSDRTMLSATIDRIGGSDAIQRDLDILEKWAYENRMMLNK